MALGLTPAAVIPWGKIITGGLGVLGVVAVLSFAYMKGSSDKNEWWLEKENERIRAEAEATIDGMRNAHKLNLDEATAAAAALARAEERASIADERAERAEGQRQAERNRNYELSQELQAAQREAAENGDMSGGALMPSGVRDQIADRLDELCRRRPAECPAGIQGQSDVQDEAVLNLAGKPEAELAGYPAIGEPR